MKRDIKKPARVVTERRIPAIVLRDVRGGATMIEYALLVQSRDVTTHDLGSM